MAVDASIDSILFDLEPLTGDDLQLAVGVLENATHTDEKGNTMRIVEYAMANEYGTTRIPSRPAFRTAADEHAEEWAEKMGELLNNGADPEVALEVVGGLAMDDIRQTIEAWKTPPNASSTIARKRSKRDNPLVDSGDYMDSIDYEIRHGRA